MKILQINSTLNWGSTGRIAEEIGQAVMAEGGESYIAYGRYANATQSKAIRIGAKWDVYFHVLQTRLFDRHGLASKRATRKLIHQIEEIKPDIIHLHNIHGYYLNYPVLFEYLSTANIPVVWTLHDCWAFTGHCSHYSFVKCDKWMNQCKNCKYKDGYPNTLLIESSKQNHIKKKKAFTSVRNMTIVTVSNWLSGEVKKSFFNKYPVRVIQNGIDLDMFHPTNVSKSQMGLDNKFVILGVSSVWNQRKGLSDFIKLHHLLDTNYVIILIGLTEKQIKNLPEGIIGIQRTNSVQELAEYYSMADIYINFSSEETFGLTTCESLACGTPALVYNSTACPEVISKATGFIVEINDFAKIVEIINNLKKAGKDKLKNVCRERAVTHFNKKERYAEYLQLYKEILKNK